MLKWLRLYSLHFTSNVSTDEMTPEVRLAMALAFPNDLKSICSRLVTNQVKQAQTTCVSQTGLKKAFVMLEEAMRALLPLGVNLTRWCKIAWVDIGDTYLLNQSSIFVLEGGIKRYQERQVASSVKA